MFGRTSRSVTSPTWSTRDPSADPARAGSGVAWVVWYPLRRAGSFEQLPPKEQMTILMEHGGIGRAYGKADICTTSDSRATASTSTTTTLIGLLGPELFPLSSCVQRMRRTRQTSLHLERLGPFFVGRVAWQSAPPAP